MNSDECNDLLIIYDKFPWNQVPEKMYEDFKEEYRMFISGIVLFFIII